MKEKAINFSVNMLIANNKSSITDYFVSLGLDLAKTSTLRSNVYQVRNVSIYMTVLNSIQNLWKVNKKIPLVHKN